MDIHKSNTYFKSPINILFYSLTQYIIKETNKEIRDLEHLYTDSLSYNQNCTIMNDYINCDDKPM